MRKVFVLLLTMMMLCMFASAQDTLVAYQKTDSTEESLIRNYNTQLDSLVNLWYVQKAGALQFSEKSKRHHDSTYVPEFSEKEYKKRIEQMNSVVSLTYNAKVQTYINVYANKRRNSVSTMLGVSECYFPIFEDIFEQYGVPQELKYLSIIESALNPKAKSPAGARGIWQFMPSTGKVYGLKINSYLDERCDPIKSTHAAAQYLNNLHSIFDDWILAIAAYNCGPGNIKKAIARSGGKKDFWDIYPYLPKETRSYVPAFIAAYYVFEHHELHNLYPRKVNMPQVDTVIVQKKLHFKQISEYLNVPLKEIQDVNPQYKADMVPYSEEGSPLYLPVEIVSPFIRQQDSIYAYKDSLFLNLQPERVVASTATNVSNSTSTAGKTKIYYTVKQGDTYSKIASKYGVSVNAIKSWNHKSSNMLHIGDKLVVYVAKPGGGSSAQKQMEVAKNNVSVQKNVQKNMTAVSSKAENSSFHTVKSGDTLWGISQAYGTTVENIKTMNGLTSTKLSPGMSLRVQ
ncbi:MAG: LysM peptidoglycan-binding domain-containing protein [Bacteroidales bacterium]|nr:LysM peptidoglycan-binding domain-containing protein [Bacteroidales bacterium]